MADNLYLYMETEEEQIQVLKKLEEKGFMWSSGHKPTDLQQLLCRHICGYVNHVINIDRIHKQITFVPMDTYCLKIG